jgi:hypothetical protein
MDSNLTAGTRDLALSGSFVIPVAVVRPRLPFGGTSLIGTDAPVIDHMRVSAAEP